MARKISPNKYVENLKRSLQSEKVNCQKMYLHTPVIIHEIGDRVIYGSWEWTHILEVFDEGKYYKVLNITSEIAYGKYVGQKFQINYIPYTNLCPYRTTEERTSPPILTKNEDLQLNYSQRNMFSLLHVYYYFGLDLNADYQRGNVWSQEDKVLLIDSIFKNIDIGKFAIIEKPYKENDKSYEILDGKQRVTALLEFAEDRFAYKGLKFSELNVYDQRHFKNYSLSYAQINPMSDKQKYRYFLNLNVSGKPVDPNHINYVKQLLKTSRGEKQ